MVLVRVYMLCVAAWSVVVDHGTDPSNSSRQQSAVQAPSEGPFAAMPVGPDTDREPPVAMLLDNPARRISFQALLTNGQGGPIANPNGQHELDFRLYDTDVAGVPIGEVLDVQVTLHDGVATAQIGPMDPDWFDGTGRWLGVTVDNGSELSPLVALGAVPYAFRVDRVASAELDDDIELGDPATGGSLSVYSGDTEPVTLLLDGPAGRLRVGSPTDQGGITVHGQGQLIETRDQSGTLVALFGYDAIGGGAACLLGTPGGTTGLLLDGSANGGDGGVVRMFNAAAAEAISLTAADATIRAGSISGGVAGNMHLYPVGGGPSTIHLDGEAGDLRLGLAGASSGNLRVYSSGGGIERIHLNGAISEVLITDGTNSAVQLDGLGKTISVFGSDGQENARMWGPDWGEILLFDSDASNDRTVSLAARGLFGDGGGALTLFNNSATAIGVSLVGGSGSGGFGWFYNAAGEITATLDADGGDGGALLSLEDGTQETIRLDGKAGGGGGGVTLSNSAGTQTVEIDADETDSAVLRLRNSAGASTIVLDASPARIGIGTSNPDQELVVQGDDPAMQIRDDTTDNSANAARLELLERAGGAYDGGAFFWWNGETNKLLIGTKESGVNTNVMVVDRATSGVGIGTQTPGNYRLAVNGAIRAKEIVVETGWSDFVFADDYKLPTLEEVEAHISVHGHLPDVPSAEEVARQGVKVGEMESKLLQKVEELTLHLIDMNKRVTCLEEENARLRSALSTPEALAKEVR